MQIIKQSDDVDGNDQICVDYPSSMKDSHRNAMTLLIRSMRLVPESSCIVIPPSLSLKVRIAVLSMQFTAQDFKWITGLLKKEILSIQSKLAQDKKRKARKAKLEAEKAKAVAMQVENENDSDVEIPQASLSKKRRIVLDDSD